MSKFILSRKRHIRSNCRTTPKRYRTQLLGEWSYGKQSVPTWTAVHPSDNPQKTEQSKIVCQYCKKSGLVTRVCRKRMGKEQEQRNDPSLRNTKPSASKAFAPCPPCQLRNYPPEKNWSGLKAANRPKRFKQDQPADIAQEGREQRNLTD